MNISIKSLTDSDQEDDKLNKSVALEKPKQEPIKTLRVVSSKKFTLHKKN